MKGDELLRSVELDWQANGRLQCRVNRHNLDVLGYSCRLVFGGGEYVVKVGVGDCNQCACEIAFWKKWYWRDKGKRYLAPLLAWDEDAKIIIQQRVLMPEPKERTLYGNHIEEIANHIGLTDVSTHYNWGMLNGQPRIYDFAI